MEYLYAHDRTADIGKVLKDAEYRDRLFKELGI